MARYIPVGPKKRQGRGARMRPEQRMAVESMLATLTPHSVIRREVAKKFGITEARVTDWIRVVYELLAEEAAPQEKDERRAQMRATLGDFYQKALLARQFNAAVVALDRLCKLDGLYAPEELAVNDKRGIADRDPDKVRQRIRELAAKNPHLLQPTEEQLSGPSAPSPPDDGEPVQ